MPGNRWRAAAIGAISASLLLGSVQAAGAAPSSQPDHHGGGRWCSRGDTGDVGQQALFGLSQDHSSTTTGITARNAGSMQQAWRVATDAPVSHAPLVDHGTVYAADWNETVYAVDLQTGRLRWKKTFGQPMTQWPWHGFAGTGEIAHGTLYEASVEGVLYAIDLADGSLRWQRRITHQQYAGNLGTPQYFNGLLYVGLSSVDEPLSKQMPPDWVPQFRGMVEAFNARTGSLVWRQPLVWQPHNGVPVWSGFAVDPELCSLYVGTGNNYTGSSSALSDSLISLNAMTGRIRWVDQTWTHDVWLPVQDKGPDWDYGNAPQLFTADDGHGHPVPAVGAGNKSGLFLAFDRRTGKPLWHTVVGYGSVAGGIRWEASLGNGTVYASSNNNYTDTNPSQFPVNVKALDMRDGSLKWVRAGVQAAVGSAAGFLSRDVYFLGDLTGTIAGYDAATGATVAQVQAPGPVSSSLNVVGDTLLAGTGVPAAYGGGPQNNGIVAFRPAG